jgi:hypothetical protein
MLSIYSFKRRTVLLGTIFASLAVAMMAQSVHAENIAGVRRAVVSNGSGSKVFRIDSSVGKGGDFLLEITRLADDGSLDGKYYPSGQVAPSSTNVTGSITIVGTTNSAIRISFTTSQSTSITPGTKLVVSETIFQGAIRLGRVGEQSFGFMAGTFTFTNVGEGGRGPFPFCAELTGFPG